MSSQRYNKVLIIGTSGAVGMATRDAVSQYMNADVITYDRPVEDPAKIVERGEKVAFYRKLVAANGKLLDGEQEKWLLKDREKLPENRQGEITATPDYQKPIREGVDVIIITSGLPRKGDMKRNDVARLNAPIFKKYGTDLADLAAREIERNPDFHLPVIINAGNPVDTMTEVLGRALHARLTEHVTDAQKSGNTELARRLAAEARSLRGKIIGQGGILDGARVATAIHDTMGIPLNDIIKAPVLGTHNEKMAIDFDNIIVRHEGKEISLREYPGANLTAIFQGTDHTLAEEIIDRTRKGGTRILQDYKELLDIDQSATLATGAALLIMADSVVHDKNATLPTVIYHIPENLGKWQHKKMGDGYVMGANAKLNLNGAEYQPSPDMASKLAQATADAKDAYGAVR